MVHIDWNSPCTTSHLIWCMKFDGMKCANMFLNTVYRCHMTTMVNEGACVCVWNCKWKYVSLHVNLSVSQQHIHTQFFFADASNSSHSIEIFQIYYFQTFECITKSPTVAKCVIYIYWLCRLLSLSLHIQMYLLVLWHWQWDVSQNIQRVANSQKGVYLFIIAIECLYYDL